MIASLRGIIESKDSRGVVVNVGGVGYQVYVTPTTLVTLTVGDEVILHTHQYVREDALELYGFLQADERATFMTLIRVSGVGPKSGLGILSTATPQELRAAVASGDVHLLTKVSGIGRKTAERLLIELKDVFSAEAKAKGEKANLSAGDAEVIEALERLGYAASEARQALGAMPEGSPEERLRAALKQLGKK
ncbi:Holliday junction branch migration protein RuvA [Candidatus Uhrbacteria bacterium CG10_big_fil_rev_8_21_14_0_10_48_11]|uniref:Holliday junction branch migration complex subunit RuvA n=1 Tax=Candidatus Uhrbacteria bacterium CG10_big_fil_rev_8_21_14_0_10_48_11 TaxID=1975037 RepID=A0A2M8LDN8_9BACT|nr:MAG: Holliday junction branch migration protein RuvA [Candidatus Uhrbacteria bacterium CG10_big_fil_rev_8_21_14_0_10_48_11]